jgi:hypothetical protein
MEWKGRMGMHITSKALKPAVGALGIAFLIGAPIGGCGHHVVSRDVNMGPSSAQFEDGNTLK